MQTDLGIFSIGSWIFLIFSNQNGNAFIASRDMSGIFISAILFILPVYVAVPLGVHPGGKQDSGGGPG